MTSPIIYKQNHPSVNSFLSKILISTCWINLNKMYIYVFKFVLNWIHMDKHGCDFAKFLETFSKI